MGVFQSSSKSSKSSYFKLIKKEIKNSYDYIQTSDFNKQYSILMNKLDGDNKKKLKKINVEGEIINWKEYLLDNFYNKKTGSWKNALYNCILNELEINYVYPLENEIFMSQIILTNFPQFYIKDPKGKNEPILFLFAPDELSNYSHEQNLMEKARKMKNKKSGSITEEKINIELRNIDSLKIRNDSEEINRFELNQSFNISTNSKHLTFGKVKEDELYIEEKDMNDLKILNKYMLQ